MKIDLRLSSTIGVRPFVEITKYGVFEYVLGDNGTPILAIAAFLQGVHAAAMDLEF